MYDPQPSTTALLPTLRAESAAPARRRWVRRLCITLALVPLLAACALATMIGLDRPTAPVPDMAMLRPFTSVDFHDLPPIETLPARDGTPLAFRRYPGRGERVALALHGASGSSASMHAIAKALQRAGVTVYAVDVRGHGASGKRGEADHLGQLEEDVEDLSAAIHSRHLSTQLTLVGFSAGGGLGLRIAAGPYADRFERYVLLAPPLGFGSGATRASGGHYSVASGRILGLYALNALGIHALDALPVLAFGVPPEKAKTMTGSYSFRLLASFGPHADALGDVRRSTQPMSILVGARDEFLVSEQYPRLVQAARSDVTVEVIPGLGHTELVTQPLGLEAITAAVTCNGTSPRRAEAR